MKKQLLLISFITLFCGSFSSLSANSVRRNDADVEVYYYDDGYYDDGVVWEGPGWYYGVWFGNEVAFNHWRRRHRHHGRYHRDGHHRRHHGHRGGHHGGRHH